MKNRIIVVIRSVLLLLLFLLAYDILLFYSLIWIKEMLQ